MGNTGSIDKVGYRVLGVQEASPASKVGLISFFDFIIAAKGIPFKQQDDSLVNLIRTCEEKELPLTIFNWRTQETRNVTIVPSKKWNGEGMLGVSIRFDTYLNAEESICRVLDVEANSPAELAGLQGDTDYLLGTAHQVFGNTQILYDELNNNIDKPIEFFVYNSATDIVRTAVVMPSTDWGGKGLLGANIGHGYLHRIPMQDVTPLPNNV